jgi:hypothetical protein
MHAVISLCTNLAGSNLESRALREGGAIRNVGQSWRRSGSDEIDRSARPLPPGST